VVDAVEVMLVVPTRRVLAWRALRRWPVRFALGLRAGSFSTRQ
jgi:hypothetical protein